MITKKELLAKFEQTFGKAPVKPACYCESCELAEYKVDAARYRGLKKIFMYEFNVPIGSPLRHMLIFQIIRTDLRPSSLMTAKSRSL